MNVGSLFTGIGGLDLGLERAGHRIIFQCESDPYRRRVLERHWPGVPIYSDVREVGADLLKREGLGGGGANGSHAGRHKRPCDLLCGGFPCQDLSVAGRRAGLAGDRSGLFFEFARIADAIRPEWLLIENVPGLLSSNGGRDFGELLGTLADLGYGVGWRILDSRYFGVPQRRRRVFILGNSLGGRIGAERCAEVLSIGQGCERHSAKGRKARAGAAPNAGSSPAEPGGTVSSLMTRRRHDPDTADQLVSFNWQSGQDQLEVDPDTTGSISKTQTPAVQRRAMVRRLTPTECERLQGFPDGWTLTEEPGDDPNPPPDSPRYAACGDAVTVNVAEWIGRRLNPDANDE